MISINVKLFGPLRDYHPDNEKGDTSKGFDYKLPKGTTVQELVDEVGLPGDDVKIVFINNKKVSFDTVINENDEIGIFPPIAGG